MPPAVITEKDVSAALAAGKRELVLPPGTILTPLARDLIAKEQVTVRWQDAEAAAGAPKTSPTGCLSGSTYCLRCGACLSPAYRDREQRRPIGDTQAMLVELEEFTRAVWEQEPRDIRELRSFSLPPMGNLPCVFYANFDLFWAGENLQVCRILAQQQAIPLKALCVALGALLERHAARLAKWKMEDTVSLLRGLSLFFKQAQPGNYEEFIAVVEAAMVALDRVQSWIDGMLPWSHLDSGLSLRPPLNDRSTAGTLARSDGPGLDCAACTVQSCQHRGGSSQGEAPPLPAGQDGRATAKAIEAVVEQVVREVLKQLA
jgi:hypothetical protein